MTKTKITFDRVWNEYVVKVWIDGIRRPQADYFTDSQDDARLTAAFLEKGGKLISGQEA